MNIEIRGAIAVHNSNEYMHDEWKMIEQFILDSLLTVTDWARVMRSHESKIKVLDLM